MSARRAGAFALVALLGCVLAAGCVGYRDYYDRPADRYAEAVRSAQPAPPDKSVRCTVNVAHYVRDVPSGPVSRQWRNIEKAAVAVAGDMGIFDSVRVGPAAAPADFHFIFNVEIRDTDEPVLTSGLILPFFRSREYRVRLQVLDENGQAFANYTASAGVFQARHVFLFWLTPFYWPGWGDASARESVFRALAVKLIKDREEFRN